MGNSIRPASGRLGVRIPTVTKLCLKLNFCNLHALDGIAMKYRKDRVLATIITDVPPLVSGRWREGTGVRTLIMN